MLRAGAQVDAVIIDQPVAVDAVEALGGGDIEIAQEIVTSEFLRDLRAWATGRPCLRRSTRLAGAEGRRHARGSLPAVLPARSRPNRSDQGLDL